MDSDYRPQSPDLGSYRPSSPRPVSPDLSGLGAPAQFVGGFNQQSPLHGGRFAGAFSTPSYGGSLTYSPTSIPPQSQYQYTPQYQQPGGMDPLLYPKREDSGDEHPPDVPGAKRARKGKGPQPLHTLGANGSSLAQQAPPQGFVSNFPDPSLGVELKTSFPVARIKRIMQADEDIGKVAQVTPHVVSRALELFMIKMIAASVGQARGVNPGQPGANSKPPAKKVTPQHLKQAILADDTFDFLHEIVSRVPDAPTKAKKEAGSESDEEKKPKRKGKRRKDSDDI